VHRSALTDSVRVQHGVPWARMPELYAAADVFALPCRTRRGGLEPEALGIVFLEAAASGLPVVVGSSGGAPEAVVDGVTGHLVDPTDPLAVADAISALLSAPGGARRMGARGRHAVAARFGGGGIGVLRQLLDVPPP
jgi:phosphatidylinositol alpha-1,6-mannosyltransferase